VKRQLNLALCDPSAVVQTNSSIVNEANEVVGSVLLAQVRGIPRKVKNPDTDEVESISVNKMVILCVLNTEVTNSTLRLDNAVREVLTIVDGRKS
jgi:hypothetical protein